MTHSPRPSIEVTGDDLAREGGSLARLPGVWDIFVAHLDGQTVAEFARDCLMVRELGHRPVPHLAARRYRDLGEFETTLRRLRREADVREALLLAGDASPPAGALEDSLAVMDSGLLEENGLERVWFAGYPGGHPKISERTLDDALERKINRSERSRTPIGIVTQLTEAPDLAAAWCEKKEFAARGIAVRVSQFLWARASVLEELAELAGLPEILPLGGGKGGGEYVRGAGARWAGAQAKQPCAPHYMALGALEKLIGELGKDSVERRVPDF